jgi:Predicted P-loop-containing kinase
MRLFIITGTSGAGKSTMKDMLEKILDPEKYACIDSDETGLNWWDYAGTDHPEKYAEDGMNVAVKRAAGKDLVFISCMAPHDYWTKVNVSAEVKATYFIGMWAPDETIRERLRARPKERGFTSDEVIRPHIEYNQWIGKNRGKYQLFVNDENQTEEETAEIIKGFITRLPGQE